VIPSCESLSAVAQKREGTRLTIPLPILRFYYDHHGKFGGWEGELKAGGPEGPVVCRAKKGFSSSFKVNFPDGGETDCVKTGMMSVTHEFRSPSSGTPYKWKNVGKLSFLRNYRVIADLSSFAHCSGIPGQGTELAVRFRLFPRYRLYALELTRIRKTQLADLTVPGEQKIVATWDTRVTWSRKNGILRVSRDYMHELEIISTTCLAMYGELSSKRFYPYSFCIATFPLMSDVFLYATALERARQQRNR